MEDGNSRYMGTAPQCSFVLAFVKGAEISQFLMEGQAVRAIARYFDRNHDTIERAISLLKEHEIEIGKKDVMAVARVVWKGRLGWERSASFLKARAHIEAGTLIPKFSTGPKRRQRRRVVGAEKGAVIELLAIVNPASPATSPIELISQVQTPVPKTDDFFDLASASSAMLSKLNRVAPPLAPKKS